MHGAPLVLYNSLTRSLETFRPIDPTNVRVYSCGPTVYHHAHIGNLRAYVFTDTLARVVTWKGWPLTHVINITDVGHLTSDADAGDDKMEAAAKARGQDIWAIAEHYTAAFKQNLRDLNVREPSGGFPRATDHVEEMKAFAATIAANGYAYRLGQDEGAAGLYFDTAKLPGYGTLARSAAEPPESSEGRIDQVEQKHAAADFALWRTSAPGESRQMEWPSEWGPGAPGWHLECSVMSRKYLGAQFDIHTGGIDHREIHHPNEIAQNQAYSGDLVRTGANWWMHNNFLVERAGKMSKSSGEFTTLQSLVDRGFHPLAYRLMCLQAHYRSELEFSWEGLAAALTRLKRWVKSLEQFRASRDPDHDDDTFFGNPAESAEVDLVIGQIDRAFSNDLNTPEALSILGSALSAGYVGQVLALVKRSDELFGLRLTTLTRRELRIRPSFATLTEAAVELHLEARSAARAAKDFARSDAIRDSLAAAGVEVMDGDPLGWDWKLGG